MLKMGNETSQPFGLEIEEKAVEISDYWNHYPAVINATQHPQELSILVGETVINGALWAVQSPLEKLSMNLKIFRHPSIVKYISSWKKGSKVYLALENVKPLSHHLAKQTILQISIGLQSILKALVFLHDVAKVSHNNVCLSSVYVTNEGVWKLGGFQFICKFSDITSEYLTKSRMFRYDKSIDPNEDKCLEAVADRREMVGIDQYAFADLCLAVLQYAFKDNAPLVLSFKDYCRNELQNSDPLKRPKLSDVLTHPFFSHDFLLVHSFLSELPLKTDSEKSEFFLGLLEKLQPFEEDVIASQLGGLLLSRMVLLDSTAQSKLLPFILNPRESDNDKDRIFSTDTFKKHIVPLLLKIFCVRDAQIRMLLLLYFKNFIYCFTKQELQNNILPELLLGIKDTNDHLVAVTLRALADLVPVLGSAVVIGGSRGRLFNDGRPISCSCGPVPRKTSLKPLSVAKGASELPERPSPDGEENETSLEAVGPAGEDTDNWSDWEPQEVVESHHEEMEALTPPPVEAAPPKVPAVANQNARKHLPDVLELDIKTARTGEEMDFFQDMEPVIQATNKFFVPEEEVKVKKRSRFDLVENEAGEVEAGEGWNDDFEWNAGDDQKEET